MISHNLHIVSYDEVKSGWPESGKHILAQHNNDSIVVYQAYSPEIAAAVVKAQKFLGSCDAFSPTRMTWIKTNFLWMMFRSGFGTKRNQERTLAIWVTKTWFETVLSKATSSSVTDAQEISAAKRDPFGFIRIQWDPDHLPSGTPHKHRRAIQLGLKEVDSFLSGNAIIRIEDISDFVFEQRQNLLNGLPLQVPFESEYIPESQESISKIGLDIK